MAQNRSSTESTDLYSALQDVFGKKFTVPEAINESFAVQKSIEFGIARNTEVFIDDKFDVDIRYHLKVDCDVEVDGFRRTSLRGMLSKLEWLKPRKKLIFTIEENEFGELVRRTNDPDYDG